ncbi:MAG TPA: DNA recombination protein RmuC [Flavobacteriaceae bacterium]|nr:DNA recombination protein RmuC [Flavobacteriaceae bacterium]
MSEIVLYVIVGILALTLGYVLANLKSKSQLSTLEERLRMQTENETKLQENFRLSEKEKDTLRNEKEELHSLLTQKKADFENLKQRNEEQKNELEKIQEKFQKEFENLANKILEEKSAKFTVQNKENLDNILKPLQEKIQSFEKRVEETNKENIDRTAQLRQQIIGLKELNEKITKEANNLTKALKGDTKMQGNWGELVLERVLERSGLQKDSEYTVQSSFVNEEGRRVMPDVIIHLPGNKKMIIDSKVSLVAYERYINETDENEKPTHLKSHILSIKTRIKELSEKNYHTLYQMDSPDFVLLFIPIESAFAIASMEQPTLYSDAFEKNIILVTPTTLLAVLKTIDSMWQNEKQKANAIEIATQAGALYDSFVNLTDELIKVGNQINTVQNSYETAMKKLTGKGNLITRVEKLKKLGVKANKQLNEKLLDRALENDADEQ